MKSITMAVVLTSCALFGTKAYAHVQLDAPAEGEVLQVGSVFTIKWHILIQHETLGWNVWYSTSRADGPWISIAEDLPAGDPSVGSVHTYDWIVPDALADEVHVRVQQDNSGMDYEDVITARLSTGQLAECIDGDGDGYGSPGDSVCPNGALEDCDDTNIDINPGASEDCTSDGDQDCDGLADADDPDCERNTVVVEQIGLSFDPADITVAPGDTIEWRFTSGIHTVTSGSPCTADGRFDLPLDGSNTSASYTLPLEEPDGVIPYFCTPHCFLGMTGTITVSSDGDLDGSNNGDSPGGQTGGSVCGAGAAALMELALISLLCIRIRFRRQHR